MCLWISQHHSSVRQPFINFAEVNALIHSFIHRSILAPPMLSQVVFSNPSFPQASSLISVQPLQTC